MIGEDLTKSLALWRCLVDPAAGLRGCVPKGRAPVPVVDGPGLSKGHICANTPQKDSEQPSPPFRLEWFQGAGLARVVTPWKGEVRPDLEGKRGTVKGMSAKSCSRARQALAAIPDSAILAAYLVTLTYPGLQNPEAVPDVAEWKLYKKQRKRFCDELLRRWGAGAFWSLEFQKRGAPHYHLIVFGIPPESYGEFIAWVAAVWNRIIKGGSDHLKAGTRVEVPKSAAGARGYLTQYMTKADQRLEETEVGRYWGLSNRAAIPTAPLRVEELTERGAIVAARVARKYVQAKRKASAWERLRRRAVELGASQPWGWWVSMCSPVEFRAIVEQVRQRPNEHPAIIKGNFPTDGGLVQLSRVSVFLTIAIAQGGKFRLPRRYKCRQNSTVNLFGLADAIAGPLLTLARQQNETTQETDFPTSAQNHPRRSRRASQAAPSRIHDGDGSRSHHGRDGGRSGNSLREVRGLVEDDGALPFSQDDGRAGRGGENDCGSDFSDNGGSGRQLRSRSRVYVLDAIPRRFGDPF